MKNIEPDSTAHNNRFERSIILFDEALDLSDEERSAFLDQACADDPELRQEIENLLQARDRNELSFIAPIRLNISPESMPHEKILEPGTLVGERYRVVRLLAEGGMAYVYEASDEDPDLGPRRVALKQLKPAFRHRSKYDLLLSKFEDDALAQVLDLIVDGEEQILVMQFIDGKTLENLIDERGRDKPFDVLQVLEWADTILGTLEYLHTYRLPGVTFQHKTWKPILHLDIKPGNLMLSRQERLYLMDFGIASSGVMNLTTSAGEKFAAPAYAPPEQLRLIKDPVSVRSDLYALGATLYHMLTQVPPSPARTRLATKPDPFRAELAGQKGIPREVRSWLQKAMALEPEERWASAAEMRAALVPIKTKVFEKLLKPKRFTIPFFLSTAAVVLLAALGFFWYTYGPQSMEAATPPDGIIEVDPPIVSSNETESKAKAGIVGESTPDPSPPVPDPTPSAAEQKRSEPIPPAEGAGEELTDSGSSEPKRVEAFLGFNDGTRGVITVRHELYDEVEDTTKTGTYYLREGKNIISASRNGYYLESVTLKYSMNGEEKVTPFIPEQGKVRLEVDPKMEKLRIIFNISRDS